ncbi:MAG: DNA repair exonuclease [Candidatus Hadarchaeales archaeon]
MRIAVMSDFHFGVKSGTTREQDSFDQAEEALRKAITSGADLILVLGDIFDRSKPSLESWARALRILTSPQLAENSGIKLVETIDKPEDSISPLALRGIPLVAIFGNHERRARGEKNPVEALEAAGKLILLNANSVTFEKNGERISLHGLSYVPERDLLPTIKAWNPKPVENSFNVLLLHQSIGSFTFSSEEKPSIQFSDLPTGFDLYLDGHVHYRAEATVHNRLLLIPGSTERTQLSDIEAGNPKGFYILDIDGKIVQRRFVELRSPRDFFYERLVFRDATLEQIYTTCRNKVKELLQRARKNTEKIPIIKLRLEGTLANGVAKIDFDPSILVEEFGKEAILEISHDRLTAKGLEERIAALRSMREKGVPIEERGILLLLEYAKDIPAAQMLDMRGLFELLAAKKEEEAKKMVDELVSELVRGGSG